MTLFHVCAKLPCGVSFGRDPIFGCKPSHDRYVSDQVVERWRGTDLATYVVVCALGTDHIHDPDAHIHVRLALFTNNQLELWMLAIGKVRRQWAQQLGYDVVTMSSQVSRTVFRDYVRAWGVYLW
jgi:hypothetical protein